MHARSLHQLHPAASAIAQQQPLAGRQPGSSSSPLGRRGGLAVAVDLQRPGALHLDPGHAQAAHLAARALQALLRDVLERLHHLQQQSPSASRRAAVVGAGGRAAAMVASAGRGLPGAFAVQNTAPLLPIQQRAWPARSWQLAAGSGEPAGGARPTCSEMDPRKSVTSSRPSSSRASGQAASVRATCAQGSRQAGQRAGGGEGPQPGRRQGMRQLSRAAIASRPAAQPPSRPAAQPPSRPAAPRSGPTCLQLPAISISRSPEKACVLAAGLSVAGPLSATGKVKRTPGVGLLPLDSSLRRPAGGQGARGQARGRDQ
jgi:hypothetical protein